MVSTLRMHAIHTAMGVCRGCKMRATVPSLGISDLFYFCVFSVEYFLLNPHPRDPFFGRVLPASKKFCGRPCTYPSGDEYNVTTKGDIFIIDHREGIKGAVWLEKKCTVFECLFVGGPNGLSETIYSSSNFPSPFHLLCRL